MSGDPQWHYAQTRLQARHGERLDAAGWQGLEAAQSGDYYLDRARATALRGFAGRIDAGMEPHALERILRAEWRDLVAEIAGWVPTAWRPAVLWVQPIAELPARAALEAGTQAAWMEADPVLSAQTLTPAAWGRRWRALWPRGAAADRQPLEELAALVTAHLAALAQAPQDGGSAGLREALAHALTRIFRRHAAAPAAVFAQLALIALDLERFRGGLLRRRLFAPARSAP